MSCSSRLGFGFYVVLLTGLTGNEFNLISQAASAWLPLTAPVVPGCTFSALGFETLGSSSLHIDVSTVYSSRSVSLPPAHIHAPFAGKTPISKGMASFVTLFTPWVQHAESQLQICKVRNT